MELRQVNGTSSKFLNYVLLNEKMIVNNEYGKMWKELIIT
jgi:hypothetical protein